MEDKAMCYEIERLTRRTSTRQHQDTQMPKITPRETPVRSGAVAAESAFSRWLHNVVQSVKPEKHSAKSKADIPHTPSRFQE
jgi:hypothetical protein